MDWASRRGRYEELIDLARRASRLITEYGEALHEAQEHSRAIEYLWIATGLVVSPGGFFVLPEAVALLPSPARMTLERALANAERDVAGLEVEVLAGVTALVFGLNPLIMLLEEFTLLGVGNADVREFAREVVSGLNLKWWAGTVGGAIPDAIKAAGMIGDIADVGDPVIMAIQGLDMDWDVWHDARHEGYLASIEQNAGGIASTYTGIGLGLVAGGLIAGAVAAAPAVGAVALVIGTGVVVGIVAAGVGTVVQDEVNDNKTTINRDVHEVGHDVHEIGDNVEEDLDSDPPTLENLIRPAPAY